MKSSAKAGGKLSGLTFVLTGSAARTERDQAKALIEAQDRQGERIGVE